MRKIAALFAPLAAGVLAASPPPPPEAAAPPVQKPAPAPAFNPPDLAKLPTDEFGELVRFGHQLFTDTQRHAPRYVGNGLNCVNCHLDAGRKANSSPLWAAYVLYPAFRKKTGEVNTYEERLQGCFLYSMNGKAPPPDSRELKSLIAYSYWLAQGAPTGQRLAGQGYPRLPKPAQAPDFDRGAKVYAEHCALCHGANGEGTRAGERYQFPPLWGKDSFNWGAGMHQIDTAAAFIKANMPLGLPNTLTDQQAWDVAKFVDGHERPADPRQHGMSVAQADAKYHDHNCSYGEQHNKTLLGRGSR